MPKANKSRKRIKKEMVIVIDRHEIRVAIIEDSKLAEIYIQPVNEKSVVGNIYLGTVKDILPGMEAAFIDIGLEKNAFLYVNETINEDEENMPSAKIENIVKKGQDIVVQISKEEIKGKGARATAQISIPGRYLVLSPYSKETNGISRKIEDRERERLKKIAGKIKPKNYGLIVRTAAEGLSEKELQLDLKELIKKWQSINRKIRKSKPVSLVYSESSLDLKAVRDWFDESYTSIIVDNIKSFKKIKDYLRKTNPSLIKKLKLYKQMLPLSDKYNLDSQIRKALRRKVWLKSGGHISIDHTEALTSIDVNTGKFVGKKSLRQTVVKTNLEALKEVVRQIRLRDIGGIIVIDFIDMYEDKDKEKVFNELNKELEKDRIKSRVIDISKIGLAEMTRKSTTESLTAKLGQKCTTCFGSGYSMKEETMAVAVERMIRKEAKTRPNKAFIFKVSPNLINYYDEIAMNIKKDTGKIVFLEEDPSVMVDSVVLLKEGQKRKVEKERHMRN